MYKQYLTQALNLMRQNRFFSFVYILGTALAISMVMMMAIVYYIRMADILPEVNRDELLLVNSATAWQKDGQSTWTGTLSFKTIKECYYPLQAVEVSTAFMPPSTVQYIAGESWLEIPGGKEKNMASLFATDAAYWKMFRFNFISGKPYTEEEFESGVCRIVLSETRAKMLFGKTDVVGWQVQLNGQDYWVAGVVTDVSAVNLLTYADAWVPFSSIPELMRSNDPEAILGRFQVCMRCKNPTDFAMVRNEIEQNRKRYNSTLHEWEYQIREGQEGMIWRDYLLSQLDWNTSPSRQLMQYALILFVFLLVPAVNLSGLSSSNLIKRIPELGLRKAFGASRGMLIVQVLSENLLLTFIGGLLGLLFSFLLVFILRNLLFGMEDLTADISLSPGMLFNFPVFLVSFGFCLLLNLLSALIPAWRSTRVSIVQAINDK